MDAPIPLQDHCLLVADPFLQDDHFTRTVIFLLSHVEQAGSFGLILNRPSPYRLHELVDRITRNDIVVMEGGPVGSDTLHFIHRCPTLIPDGQAISGNLFWGGDFEAVQTTLEKNQLSPTDIRFFLGYSGWGAGQLLREMEEKTWLTASLQESLLFDVSGDVLWKETVRTLGPAFRDLLHYPLDPQLN